VPVPHDVRRDGLSQLHVNLAIALMGAYVGAASDAGVRSRGRSRLFRGALLAFGLHGFGHLGLTTVLRQYTSGVATSATIVIPYWLWARRTLARERASDRDGTASWAAAGILLIPTVHVLTRLLLARTRHAALGRRTRLPISESVNTRTRTRDPSAPRQSNGLRRWQFITTAAGSAPLRDRAPASDLDEESASADASFALSPTGAGHLRGTSGEGSGPAR
jgi:hypothetical protein